MSRAQGGSSDEQTWKVSDWTGCDLARWHEPRRTAAFIHSSVEKRGRGGALGASQTPLVLKPEGLLCQQGWCRDQKVGGAFSMETASLGHPGKRGP